MSNATNYINKFFSCGKIVVRDIEKKTVDADKKLFESILAKLHIEHPKFIETCLNENIINIDNKNLIIELIL